MQAVLSEMLSSASYQTGNRDEGCRMLSELVSVSRPWEDLLCAVTLCYQSLCASIQTRFA